MDCLSASGDVQERVVLALAGGRWAAERGALALRTSIVAEEEGVRRVDL